MARPLRLCVQNLIRRKTVSRRSQPVSYTHLDVYKRQVNVDAMLVEDLLGPNCDLETISGGCDCDTHQRRMRTKLIAMAMRGFDRVAVSYTHLP